MHLFQIHVFFYFNYPRSENNGNNHVFRDKQIWQKYNPIFKNYYNLNFKGMGYLIFPAHLQWQGVESHLWICQIW